MEYTMRRTVQVEVGGVTFSVEVATDSAWSEWYPESIKVDDSERELMGLIDHHAPDLLEDIEEATDIEIKELLYERILA